MRLRARPGAVPQRVGAARERRSRYLRRDRFLKQYARLYADALKAKLYGTAEETRQKAWALFRWAREHEMDLQPLLDVFEFQLTMGPFFGIPRKELVG